MAPTLLMFSRYDGSTLARKIESEIGPDWSVNDEDNPPAFGDSYLTLGTALGNSGICTGTDGQYAYCPNALSSIFIDNQSGAIMLFWKFTSDVPDATVINLFHYVPVSGYGIDIYTQINYGGDESFVASFTNDGISVVDIPLSINLTANTWYYMRFCWNFNTTLYGTNHISFIVGKFNGTSVTSVSTYDLTSGSFGNADLRLGGMSHFGGAFTGISTYIDNLTIWGNIVNNTDMLGVLYATNTSIYSTEIIQPINEKPYECLIHGILAYQFGSTIVYNSILSGSLPNGLSIEAYGSAARIYGTPSLSSPYTTNYVIRLRFNPSDGNAYIIAKITLNVLTIETDTLITPVIVGNNISNSIVCVGNTGLVTWGNS